MAIGENRFELLMVEVQEERERLLHAIVLALGAAALTTGENAMPNHPTPEPN